MSEYKIKPIKGNYYWVKPFKDNKYEPAICKTIGDTDDLWFGFTDGSVIRVKNAFDYIELTFKN